MNTSLKTGLIVGLVMAVVAGLTLISQFSVTPPKKPTVVILLGPPPPRKDRRSKFQTTEIHYDPADPENVAALRFPRLLRGEQRGTPRRLLVQEPLEDGSELRRPRAELHIVYFRPRGGGAGGPHRRIPPHGGRRPHDVVAAAAAGHHARGRRIAARQATEVARVHHVRRHRTAAGAAAGGRRPAERRPRLARVQGEGRRGDEADCGGVPGGRSGRPAGPGTCCPSPMPRSNYSR